MDPRRFDALARSLTVSRRGALGGLVAGALPALVPALLLEAKKKKHKKKKKCKVNCAGKVCGPSNCKGKTCGTCGSGTVCNAQGQCVGCATAEQCPVLTCKQAVCIAEVCKYDNLSNTACDPAGNTCCDGECVDTLTDPDHCGSCVTACIPGTFCQAGNCVQCRDRGDCPADDPCLNWNCDDTGTCVSTPAANGTNCGQQQEQCRDGFCISRPNCDPVGHTCSPPSGQCCSEICAINQCAPSFPGGTCLTTADCFAGACVAYQCV